MKILQYFRDFRENKKPDETLAYKVIESISWNNKFMQVNSNWIPDTSQAVHTVQNTEILRNSMVWKFCGKANRPKLYRVCAFPCSFHTRKLGHNSIFYAVPRFSIKYYRTIHDKSYRNLTY